MMMMMLKEQQSLSYIEYISVCLSLPAIHLFHFINVYDVFYIQSLTKVYTHQKHVCILFATLYVLLRNCVYMYIYDKCLDDGMKNIILFIIIKRKLNFFLSMFVYINYSYLCEFLKSIC